MRFNEIIEKEITEIEDIGELSYGKGWQGHKRYFVKPKEILRQDNLILVSSTDDKFNSISIAWFDPSEYEKKHKKPFPTIKSMREINNPDLILASVLETNKPSTLGGRLTVTIVGTEPKYQGKGLAFKLYDYVIKNFGRLYSDSKQSPAGRAMWLKLFKSGKYNIKAEDLSTSETAPVKLVDDTLVSKLDLDSKSVRLFAEAK